MILGGALGTAARYGIGLLIPTTAWPWPTFLVNIVGSFFAGVMAEWGTSRLSEVTSTAITVGLLGGFTTFSAFSAQTLHLARDGRPWLAGAYVATSVMLGLGAGFIGLVVGSRLTG